MNTKAIGYIGEEIAVKYLIEKGYEILERNVIYCGTEVDIIACKLPNNMLYNPIKQFFIRSNFRKKLIQKNILNLRNKSVKSLNFYNKKIDCTIVFCEVKTRMSEDFGSFVEAVTPAKVGRYIRAAKEYVSMHKLGDVPVRFDIIGVTNNKIEHIEGAFDTCDAKF